MLRRDFVQALALNSVACGCAGNALAQPRPRGRCGNTNPIVGAGLLTPKAFGTKGAGRGKFNLTWAFTGTVPGISNANNNQQVVTTINNAFAKWRAVVPQFSFTAAGINKTPDISIVVGPLAAGFLGLTKNDGSMITIASGVMFGTTFAAPGNTSGNSLLWVLIHEIGHALGLLHATTASSIMFPTEGSVEALGPDDVNAIKALYSWSPQRKLQGGTENGPALCACGGTLVMAWRGAGDDDNIWLSTTTDGQNWTPQRRLGDVGSLGSPGLAWDGTRLWLAWRGGRNDDGLYFKNSTDFFINNNPGQQHINGGGSSHGPRIAIIAGIPTMVWKGVNNDHGIYFSQFTGGKWQNPNPIPNVGTDGPPAICPDVAGGARLLWRGIGRDDQLWTTFTTGSQLNWQPQRTLSWVIQGNGGSGTTSGGTAASTAGPALALNGGFVQAAWQGAVGDDGIWYDVLGNDVLNGVTVPEWSSQTNVPGIGTSDSPALAFFNGALHMAWKGVKNDTGIWTATL